MNDFTMEQYMEHQRSTKYQLDDLDYSIIKELFNKIPLCWSGIYRFSTPNSIRAADNF